MLKLKIIQTDKYANYVLEDKDKKRYEVNINFMNMEKPKLGSIIYIPESVIKENISLNFGMVEDANLKDEDELIALVIDNNKIYLERYYG